MHPCQSCTTPTPNEYALCPTCELRLSITLLTIANNLTPLRDSLDATLHPGGPSPIRTQTATPPTPIRLEVLDIIELTDSIAYELLRRLDGINAQPCAPNKPATSLYYTLVECAAHNQLAKNIDIGMYMHELTTLLQKINHLIDPPEERQPIGICQLCSTLLTSGQTDQWVTCPTCNHEQRVLTIKLKRLERLCFDTTHTGTAAQIATTFTNSGITIQRNTITKWAERGKISPTGKKDGKPVYSYADIYRRVIAPAA